MSEQLYQGMEPITPEVIPDLGYGYFQHGISTNITVLYKKMGDELLKKLKEHALNNLTDDSIREHLAGSIDEEFRTPFDNVPELKAEMDAFLKISSMELLQNPNLLTPNFDWMAWTNIQRPGDYNPVHLHTGCQLSWVCYLEIPECIRQEYKQHKTTLASRGLIKFYSSYSLHEMTFNPKEGDFFLFVADHRHAVGSFYSENARRISMAGNIITL